MGEGEEKTQKRMGPTGEAERVVQLSEYNRAIANNMRIRFGIIATTITIRTQRRNKLTYKVQRAMNIPTRNGLHSTIHIDIHIHPYTQRIENE